MPKSKITIISFSFLAITSLLTIYFIFRIQQLNGELQQVNQKVRALEDPSIFRQPLALESMDSLLLKGRYAEALNAYQMQAKQVSDTGFSRALQLRMQLTRQLIDQQSKQTEEKDTVSTFNITIATPQITQEEVRQFDSLNFALDKAHMQINYLERQLKENTGGAYLTFKTSKGKQVHYVGTVKNKKANGNGVALLSTGSRYEGEWKNNLRHGQGTFYWPDGQYYQGYYKDDKRHGLGTYHWPNGEKFTGQWKNDQRNGEGTFYGKEGEIVAKGIWKKDDLVKVDKQ